MSIQENLTLIRSQIGVATLVAVSKQQPSEKIQAALDAGQRVFGENRVQEAQKRWAGLRSDYADLELHLIGPLQTNKAADAVALFDIIQTLDREKLARALAAEMKKQDKILPCFIQVNTGNESQKSGIAPENLGAFLKFCRDECGLIIKGLMCIPPIDEPATPHFKMLAGLAKDHNLSDLSMGMSGDYIDAIKEGATFIRVGTGVFGARENQ